MAIWLLTFIAGALIATFTYLAKAGAVSEDQAVAALLADEILERSRRAGPPLWGHAELTGTRAVTLKSGSQTEFSWQLKPFEIEASDMGAFYQLKVEVSWHNDRKTAERGRQSLVRIRSIYLDDF